MSYVELLRQFTDAGVSPAAFKRNLEITAEPLLEQTGSVSKLGNSAEPKRGADNSTKTEPRGFLVSATDVINTVCQELELNPIRFRETLSDDDCQDIAEGCTSLTNLRDYARLLLRDGHDLRDRG